MLSRPLLRLASSTRSRQACERSASAARNLRDAILVHHPREPVAAEHADVAGLQVADADFYLGLVGEAEGAGDHVGELEE
jgi:hypothetical protein